VICETCAQHGGYEGEPEAEAYYLVTITAPRAEADANAPELLCEHHARQVAESYLGWGWAVRFDHIPGVGGWETQVSSLVDSGTSNEITGG
jgi:hypothetical protein